MNGFGYSMCTCRGITNLKAQSAAAAASFEDCPNSICRMNMTTAVVRTILNSKNYDVWSSQMKTYLLAKDLWDIIDEGTDERPKTEDEEKAEGKARKKKDAKALYAIQNSCGDDTYELIKDKTTAKAAWNTLSEKLEKPSEPSDEKDERSVDEAYPTPTKPEVAMEEGRTEGAGHHEIKETFVKFYQKKIKRKETWDAVDVSKLSKLSMSGSAMDAVDVSKLSMSGSAMDAVDVSKLSMSESAMEEGLSVSEGHDESFETIETLESNANRIQETFVKHVGSNDWENAINFLRQHPQAASASMTDWPYGTALHYAIRKRCSVHIIQQLVELMDYGHLEITDTTGSTALYELIRLFPERVEVAECMVKKNPNLLTILPMGNKKSLVVVAQGKTKGERMARYLYSLTPPETIKVIDAAQLISDGFRLQRFNIAWNLIQRSPKLAMATGHDKNIPLGALASNRFAFKSKSTLSLWETLIYNGICIKPLPPINKEKHESEQSDQGHLSDQEENQSHHLISSGMSLFRRLMTNLQTHLGINRIYQMKLVHERVQQFLLFMCNAMRQEDMNDYRTRKLDEALCVAAEQGHVKYIRHFFRHSSYPVLNVRNGKNQSLFQIAAECRHYKVYKLICEKLDKDGLDKSEYGLRYDKLGHNMLHTVAMITPLSQIDHIQGAALQMQRELQWLKEVERIANPKDCESIKKDKKTPREIFTENHKELAKEAEKSMKETATSCTVVGALVVTIMFTAAFTVPGGNEEKTSLPQAFTTFIVLDAISLFSSTTSVIMFLGILTSRYSEDDFYKSLPRKMIIGLFTLFLSIATMMIVFSCGLYIILDGKSSIVIPSIVLAGFPVASFIWMQFLLLKDLSISTFGWGNI